MYYLFIFFPCAGIGNDNKKLYGVQFHPEVDLTENGKTMLKNFLMDICGFQGNYTMQGREQACIDYIKKTVGTHKVLVGHWTVVAACLNHPGFKPAELG